MSKANQISADIELKQLASDDLFPYGQFAGTPMSDVPVEHLNKIWMSGKKFVALRVDRVADYIRRNLPKLKRSNPNLKW